jgi:hypothetical protein
MERTGGCYVISVAGGQEGVAAGKSEDRAREQREDDQQATVHSMNIGTRSRLASLEWVWAQGTFPNAGACDSATRSIEIVARS